MTTSALDSINSRQTAPRTRVNTQSKRKGGRPAGSKNKPKQGIDVIGTLTQAYNQVKTTLDELDAKTDAKRTKFQEQIDTASAALNAVDDEYDATRKALETQLAQLDASLLVLEGDSTPSTTQ